MMALMPLILIVVRLMNTRRFGQSPLGGDSSFKSEFLTYGQGLIASGGILYVFLVLSGLLCNQFAFEEGGMRALILSPMERRRILIGKNIAITLVALCFSVALLILNQLIFRDLTIGSIFFAGVSFVIFAALMSVMGNWFSVRFPKRMKFGKRLNVSGVVGVLLIPMLIVLTLPLLGAVAAGYVTRSLAIEYVTLLLFAALAIGFYLLVIDSQGQLLQRREVEILEAVREPTDD
jgi:ABC-2 type transport system permease protein